MDDEELAGLRAELARRVEQLAALTEEAYQIAKRINDEEDRRGQSPTVFRFPR